MSGPRKPPCCHKKTLWQGLLFLQSSLDGYLRGHDLVVDSRFPELLLLGLSQRRSVEATTFTQHFEPESSTLQPLTQTLILEPQS